MIINNDERQRMIIETARREARKALSENGGIRLATVTQITPEGKAVIQFDEDDLPARKVYKAVDSFVPVLGQRVMLFNNIIIGGWTV